MTTDTSGRFVSVRVTGWRSRASKATFHRRSILGWKEAFAGWTRPQREDFRIFVSRVLSERNAASEEISDEFYRLQSERWLESMLVNDITRHRSRAFTGVCLSAGAGLLADRPRRDRYSDGDARRAAGGDGTEARGTDQPALPGARLLAARGELFGSRRGSRTSATFRA